MGTDMRESMGHVLEPGKNLTISLTPDTLEEAQRLSDALRDQGSDVMGLQQMFWGAYWGTCRDRFGTRWMLNFPVSAQA
jgi:PhnB protein